MNVVIVGASAGLGRALAERAAAAGHDLMLASSDERDLAALATDLRIRNGVRVATAAVDLGLDGAGADAIMRAATELGGADAVLFPVGWTTTGDEAALDPELAERLVRTNFLGIATVVGGFLPGLRQRPRATIVGFGSVAATRGRGANVVYAASKRALQTYFESLRHACAGTNVRVQFYILGYLDTNLAFGRKTLLPGPTPIGWPPGSCAISGAATASCTIPRHGAWCAASCRSCPGSSSSV